MEHNNLILIDKPKGITSFDVIRKLRKKLGVKKMGHAGTLDPLATGLMIIGVAGDTKKLGKLIGLPKTYEADVLLGTQTTTGDLAGDIIAYEKINHIDKKEITKILENIVGELELPVPIYSAIKRGGEALYKKARRGEKITPPKKKMIISSMTLYNIYKKDEGYILSLSLDVSSGTYIRSIAEEIGRRLSLPATLASLRRIRIGKFSIKNAQSL